MNEPRKISDFPVIITGVIAWSLLAFGAVKLVVIYSTSPALAAMLTYNIAGIIFLLYFLGYLKSRFTIVHLLVLWLTYNIGLVSCNWLYNYLFVLRPNNPMLSTVTVLAFVNLAVLFCSRGLLYLLKRKRP